MTNFALTLTLSIILISARSHAQNSCIEAGYSQCCTTDLRNCGGSLPATCFCDSACVALQDCCADQHEVCNTADYPYNDSSIIFLVYADNRYISAKGIGADPRRLVEVPSGGAFALDVDTVRRYVYWTDNMMNTISRANLDTGTDIILIANASSNPVGDLAVDWVANNLYWTELRQHQIVVKDLDTNQTTSLVQGALNETFKAIAVDPIGSVMFWSVWGDSSNIQTASMDGTNRRVVQRGLMQPNDIALDIPQQRLYWTNGMLGTIQFSNYDGSNTGLFHQDASKYFFGVTLDRYLVFFGDWMNNSISYAHKSDVDSPVLLLKDSLTPIAKGLELVTPNKQPTIPNPCEATFCAEICVLRDTAPGYSCRCLMGYTLDPNGRDCIENPVTVPTPPEITCAATLNITSCCMSGSCGSSCYCDVWCRYRGDCCRDIDSTCPRPSSSCTAAGYSSCCEEGECQGMTNNFGNCFCNDQCRDFGNCCDDIDVTCPRTTVTMPPERNELPFLQLNASSEIETEAVGHFDDGVSHAINILPNGFPFEGTLHTTAFIGTNGIISFDQPVYSAVPVSFPSSRNDIRNLFAVAPFWDDIDIRLTGNIFYEIHSVLSGNQDSISLIARVDSYIQGEVGGGFSGEWMLVIQWNAVHPWPHGSVGSNPLLGFLFPQYTDINTWQAILITNGTKSYAVFTYLCGAMSWSYNSVIGYNAAGRVFRNHPLSGRGANRIACANAPASNWTNVLYDLTTVSLNISAPPTVEPSQSDYLPLLRFLNVSSSGTLSPCQNCSSNPINLGLSRIPFGYYYHEQIYVGVNGIISFDRPFAEDSSVNFPSMDGNVHFSYLVAPYWSDIDTRRSGTVHYEYYNRGNSTASDQQLDMVRDFIQKERDPSFEGEWMLLAAWENVHPYPHGESADLPRENPYLESVNSFQAIIITNFTKTYAIYTYNCDQMEWSDEAAIGFNAAGDFFMNHPLGGQLQANAIGCVHVNQNQSLNNVIYDLVPEMVNDTTPPPPRRSLGSCVLRNYTDCCDRGNCTGLPPDCMCDEFCHLSGDCCHDIAETCNRESPPDNDTYLIFANRPFINRINVDGNFFHIIAEHDGQIALGIDFDYRRGYIYWSDASTDQVYRSSFNGTSVESLANATDEDIEDIALDWVANNLYWTESRTGNLEVLDLDTMERKVILNTGPNTIPRGVALDPATREIYWTDWGSPAKIEKASLDGSARRALFNRGLVWPNGITLDYPVRRVYWVDAFLDRIEYCSYDGSGRTVLRSRLLHPFALTLEGNFIFWTDWTSNSVFVAHKQLALNARVVRDFLRDRPYGIEAVTPTRQANVTNPCASMPCSHICLLSSTDSRGYQCTCPRGYELLSNGNNCIDLATMRPPLVIGSCATAGYTQCCSGLLGSNFCVGSEPHNCYCDQECFSRNDCCPDINSTCPREGSCRDAGYQACCNPRISNCRGSDRVCLCDIACVRFGDCCDDFNTLCTGGFPGTCAAAGYRSCCLTGDCFGTPQNCKCDASCRTRGDCCSDINSTCTMVTTPPPVTTTTSGTLVPSSTISAPTTSYVSMSSLISSQVTKPPVTSAFPPLQSMSTKPALTSTQLAPSSSIRMSSSAVPPLQSTSTKPALTSTQLAPSSSIRMSSSAVPPLQSTKLALTSTQLAPSSSIRMSSSAVPPLQSTKPALTSTQLAPSSIKMSSSAVPPLQSTKLALTSTQLAPSSSIKMSSSAVLPLQSTKLALTSTQLAPPSSIKMSSSAPIQPTSTKPSVQMTSTIQPMPSPTSTKPVTQPSTSITLPPMETPTVTTPQVTTPKVTTPQVTTPKVTTPQATTPKVTTPQATTPKVITPQVTTPKVTTPQVTTMTIAPPIAIINFQALGVNDTTLAVSWTGIQGINLYYVQVRNYSGELTVERNFSSQDGGSSFNYTLSTNIGPYIPYNVTINGISDDGGKLSVISRFYIFTAQAVPPVAPRMVSGKRTSDDSMNVTWQKLTPDVALGNIINYTAVWYKKLNDKSGKTKRQTSRSMTVVDGDRSEVFIDGLDKSSDYFVTVWANTTAGKGRESTPIVVPAIVSSTDSSRSQVQPGAIAGGVIGAVMFIVLIVLSVLAILWLVKTKNKVKNTSYALFENDEKKDYSKDGQAQITTTGFGENLMPLDSFENPVYAQTRGKGLGPLPYGGVNMDDDFESELIKEDMMANHTFDDDVIEL